MLRHGVTGVAQCVFSHSARSEAALRCAFTPNACDRTTCSARAKQDRHHRLRRGCSDQDFYRERHDRDLNTERRDQIRHGPIGAQQHLPGRDRASAGAHAKTAAVSLDLLDARAIANVDSSRREARNSASSHRNGEALPSVAQNEPPTRRLRPSAGTIRQHSSGSSISLGTPKRCCVRTAISSRSNALSEWAARDSRPA
jgi:hypothetical protein